MSDKLDYSDELIAERRTGDPGQLPDDMPIWMRNIITWIDTFGDWSGGLFCWMLLPLMFAMVYEVVARKLFIAPTDWAYDVSRMLSGGMFMIGAGYALLKGVHIRADFLYRTWSPRTQGIVDASLYIIFFFPAMWFFFDNSYVYALKAWTRWGTIDGYCVDGASSSCAHGDATGCGAPGHSGRVGTFEINLCYPKE